MTKALHACTICGTREPWGPGWTWYGSYRDIEDGVPVTKICSGRCIRRQIKQELKEKGISMLGLNMKLTPAQVRMLITLYGEHWAEELLAPSWPKEGMAGFHFTTTMRALINKGLVDHDMDREPTYQLTDAGRGLADVVLYEARKVLAMVDGLEERTAEMRDRVAKSPRVVSGKADPAKHYAQQPPVTGGKTG